MTVKLLEDCKKCDKYVGMYSVSSVECKRVDYCNVLVSVMPSFWNKGIQNGVMIVNCLKEYI